MDDERGGVPGCGSRLPRGLRLGRDEPVELAGSGSLSRAGDWLLAGPRPARAVADPVREPAGAWRLARSLALTHVARALGEHEPGGARAAAGAVPGALRAS